MEFSHYSVMLKETIEELKVKSDGIYVDGTLGGGGHAYEVCKRLSDAGHFYGIDQDAAAIAAASQRLSEFGDRVTIIRSNYCEMCKELRDRGVTGVDGIVLDLGVSSYQLDEADRGFTYREDAALDMRMDQRQEKTARDIVNGYSEMDLYRIIRDYGEDKFAKNIAKHIVQARERQPIETTGELVEIIKAAIPAKIRMQKGHPAKQTFQAIRIELNRELEVLRDSLDDMIDFLNPGGRLCIITFHSLEDRIVKNAFRKNEHPCTCPPDFPVCVCGKTPKGKVVTRKPILPGEGELGENSRSKSAKLRVFERRLGKRLETIKWQKGRPHMSTGRKRRVIEGNTVRTLHVREERHYRRQEESHAYRVERDQKIQYTTVIYMMFLTIAAAMVLWSCVTYLQLQAETTSRVKNIAALETELEDLKKENDDNYTRIMTSVDLDYIRDVAINELGMVYANEDQVILYDGGTKDYVRQSQDVPKDSKNSLMDQLLGKNGK